MIYKSHSKNPLKSVASISVSIGQIVKELTEHRQRFVIVCSVSGEKPKRMPGSGGRIADSQPIYVCSEAKDMTGLSSRRQNVCSDCREISSFPCNGLVIDPTNADTSWLKVGIVKMHSVSRGSLDSIA